MLHPYADTPLANSAEEGTQPWPSEHEHQREIVHPAAAAPFVNFLPRGKQMAAPRSSLSQAAASGAVIGNNVLQPLQRAAPGTAPGLGAVRPPRLSALEQLALPLQPRPSSPGHLLKSVHNIKVKPNLPPLHQAHKQGLFKIQFW